MRWPTNHRRRQPAGRRNPAGFVFVAEPLAADKHRLTLIEAISIARATRLSMQTGLLHGRDPSRGRGAQDDKTLEADSALRVTESREGAQDDKRLEYVYALRSLLHGNSGGCGLRADLSEEECA